MLNDKKLNRKEIEQLRVGDVISIHSEGFAFSVKIILEKKSNMLLVIDTEAYRSFLDSMMCDYQSLLELYGTVYYISDLTLQTTIKRDSIPREAVEEFVKKRAKIKIPIMLKLNDPDVDDKIIGYYLPYMVDKTYSTGDCELQKWIYSELSKYDGKISLAYTQTTK